MSLHVVLLSTFLFWISQPTWEADILNTFILKMRKLKAQRGQVTYSKPHSKEITIPALDPGFLTFGWHIFRVPHPPLFLLIPWDPWFTSFLLALTETFVKFLSLVHFLLLPTNDLRPPCISKSTSWQIPCPSQPCVGILSSNPPISPIMDSMCLGKNLWVTLQKGPTSWWDGAWQRAWGSSLLVRACRPNLQEASKHFTHKPLPGMAEERPFLSSGTESHSIEEWMMVPPFI